MSEHRWFRRPSALLRPFIDRYWGWEGALCVPQHILPGTGAECLFHYRSPFLLNGQTAARSVLLCPRTGPIAVEASGAVGFVAVRFRSGRLRHFCGQALAQLHDQEWPAQAIWGDAAERLADQLAQADGATSRVAMLDQFFLARLGEHEDRASQKLDALQERLYYAPGTGIDFLAEQSGWTRRHLQRKFSDAYGIGPKHFARLARLGHTMRMLALAPNMAPLDAALRMGYFDQAHFIHETRALVGATPQPLIDGMRRKSHFYNPPSRPVA